MSAYRIEPELSHYLTTLVGQANRINAKHGATRAANSQPTSGVRRQPSGSKTERTYPIADGRASAVVSNVPRDSLSAPSAFPPVNAKAGLGLVKRSVGYKRVLASASASLLYYAAVLTPMAILIGLCWGFQP